jgi:multidrug efflux pump subunit AcrB
MLLGKAAMVRDSLLTGERIGNVRISSSQPYWGNMSKAKREFTFDMNPQKLAEKQQALSDLFRDLRAQVPSDLQTVSLPWMGMYVPVVLRDANTMRTSVWDLDHRLNATQGRAYRLPELGTITQKEAAQEVVKENQVYQLFLLYSFMGPDKLHERYKEQKIVDIQNHLPLGFKASLPDWSWWNAKEKSQYWLLLLVFVVIFFISAILLESLWQAFAVVLFIPMSFVGLFLVYILSDLGFDQGGYAAMVMLSGLTVNAALYLINYYNRERVLHPNRTAMVHYIKAFHHKIVPILLTILSTIVGLIPFLLADDSDSFWRNLAAGSIGGLLVSVLTVVVWLPLLLIRKDKKS